MALIEPQVKSTVLADLPVGSIARFAAESGSVYNGQIIYRVSVNLFVVLSMHVCQHFDFDNNVRFCTTRRVIPLPAGTTLELCVSFTEPRPTGV